MCIALTLLIVDGHSIARTALVERLQRMPGVTVVGAVADVAAALQVNRHLAPDLVLYEPKTVEGDPLHTLHALATGGRPVVVWTSSLVPGEDDALLQAGATAVLLKDKNLLPLLETLATASAPHRQALVSGDIRHCGKETR